MGERREGRERAIDRERQRETKRGPGEREREREGERKRRNVSDLFWAGYATITEKFWPCFPIDRASAAKSFLLSTQIYTDNRKVWAGLARKLLYRCSCYLQGLSDSKLKTVCVVKPAHCAQKKKLPN